MSKTSEVRASARKIKQQTGLSLPVCKIVARWLRHEMGPLFGAYERDSGLSPKAPKLIRRARKALTVAAEGPVFADEQTGRYTLWVEGPKGGMIIGSGWL